MGIKITIDAFSGRPDPYWEIYDQSQIEDLLHLFTSSRSGLADPGKGLNDLGFRGILVSFTSDTQLPDLPVTFKVGGGGAADPAMSAEVAERLLDTSPVRPAPGRPRFEDEANDPLYSEEFMNWVRTEIRRYAERAARPGRTAESDEESSDGPATNDTGDGQCPYNVTAYNPGFWNAPPRLERNNCYNYAVNDATDTFAQPGRRHHYTIPPTSTCGEVAHGALLDGLHVWGDCFPPGEMQYVVALVTGWLGGIRDYHWYRLHEGFWAHKPGRTLVRNTDYSGQLIINPELCDRGGYTEWCGLMQVGDDTRIS